MCTKMFVAITFSYHDLWVQHANFRGYIVSTCRSMAVEFSCMNHANLEGSIISGSAIVCQFSGCILRGNLDNSMVVEVLHTHFLA